MGVVLLARDLRLDRMVAIKTLPHHLADDVVIRERFLREARTAAALSHPRIVPIHHAAEANGTVFFVMGLVDGGSVAQRVREQGKLPTAMAVSILADVAEALGYAHARGVVHRDVKAENILIDRATGRAQVTDFGIARLAESAPMTATGTVLGTVHYMSPEQVSGEKIDGRSDLYALGVLAFLMLSGRFPFEHEAASAVLVAHVVSHAPGLRSLAPDVPPPLAEVVDRLLRKNPADRYATAEEVLAALSRIDLDPAADLIPTSQPILSSAEANQVWERAALLQEMTGQIVPPPMPVRERPPPPRPGLPDGVTPAAAEELASTEVLIGHRRAHTVVEHCWRPGRPGSRRPVDGREAELLGRCPDAAGVRSGRGWRDPPRRVRGVRRRAASVAGRAWYGEHRGSHHDVHLQRTDASRDVSPAGASDGHRSRRSHDHSGV
jgi:serine/threonine protein kinase